MMHQAKNKILFVSSNPTNSEKSVGLELFYCQNRASIILLMLIVRCAQVEIDVRVLYLRANQDFLYRVQDLDLRF